MLHVAFTPSVAGVLIELMRVTGTSDPVVFLDEDYAVGPLDGDASARATALSDIYWEQLDPRGAQALAKRWEQLVSAPALTVWLRRDRARDVANLLELAHRRAAPLHVAELPTDIDPEELTRSDQLLHVQPQLVDDLSRARDRARWGALRGESAALRVLDGGTLRSAPIDAFDAAILANTPTEWGIFHVVARHAGGHSERLTYARMLALIDAGAIELEELEDPAPVYRLRVRRVA